MNSTEVPLHACMECRNFEEQYFVSKIAKNSILFPKHGIQVNAAA